ncbi:MAG TPA: hypothetical protein VG429_05725 [Casimicrobiaceae bacterium]|jgi:hypothetical protein|nr:hypothetical protein [Casimicrobiaceae bacterium]
MAEQRRGGFRYAVGDEQLAAYARMTLRQRLEWVDAARILTLKLRTPETAIRQERLRQGLSIDGPAPPGFVA